MSRRNLFELTLQTQLTQTNAFPSNYFESHLSLSFPQLFVLVSFLRLTFILNLQVSNE